jgi:hypothetical protein
VPPTENLKSHLSQLADEELLAQLADERLTNEAARLARAELASRGAAIEQGVARARTEREHAAIEKRAVHDKRRTAIRRVVRFPLRALLGIESPWMVLAIGIPIVYLLYRASVAAISSLVLQHPLPGYALPLSYVALAIFESACLWLAVSLLRCAPKAGKTFVVWFLRALGVFLLIGTINSVFNLVPVIQQAARVG